MEFIREKTRVPVPKVHFAFFHNDWTYIVMDFIDADTLDEAQLSLSETHLSLIAVQLKDIVTQIRDLGGPHVTMGSWPRGPFRNCYFRQQPPEEEFKGMEEFQGYWAGRAGEGGDESKSEVAPTCASVLTHGDLSSRNLLVKDGCIVAVIDWDTFGWYPEFWEINTIYRGAWTRQWIKAVSDTFGRMNKEGIHCCQLVERAFVQERGY
jgi:aminoglycoside phosphotransferase